MRYWIFQVVLNYSTRRLHDRIECKPHSHWSALSTTVEQFHTFLWAEFFCCCRSHNHHVHRSIAWSTFHSRHRNYDGEKLFFLFKNRRESFASSQKKTFSQPENIMVKVEIISASCFCLGFHDHISNYEHEVFDFVIYESREWCESEFFTLLQHPPGLFRICEC